MQCINHLIDLPPENKTKMSSLKLSQKYAYMEGNIYKEEFEDTKRDNQNLYIVEDNKCPKEKSTKGQTTIYNELGSCREARVAQ